MTEFSAALDKILSKTDLAEEEAYSVLQGMLRGDLTPAQIGGFLTALRSKGECADEILGFIRAMREAMVKISCSEPIVIDTCGTGGDGKKTFNISTAAAFVVAGAGFLVAKHGNRSVSSTCGSADILEALGVNILMSRESAERALNEIGITFLFAPLYHPAMKHVAPIRKELGVRTVFNLLGPLVNPAGANVQVIGVPREEVLTLLASVLVKLSQRESRTACLVHESGYDEVVLNGEGAGLLIRDGNSTVLKIRPRAFNLERVSPESLTGGDAQQNAQLLQKIFEGEKHPLQNVIVANAALAIHSSHPFTKKGVTLSESALMAWESLAGGKALQKLKSLIEWSHKG
ncbi:MAG: anthranilate phosphoribosyltransferase [Elusimicrobia bacterium]|nr:anthranilate phosphoribosyltransferase [Elusimicrobiota bacterium]